MEGDRIHINKCGCGAIIPPRRKKCDACNELAKKAHAVKVEARRKERIALMVKAEKPPKPVHVSKYDLPKDYPQVERYQPWEPKPRRVLVSPPEQARIDAEARQRDAAAHERYVADFGLVITPGRPLAGKARSLTPAEIAALEGVYQPPKRRVGWLLPYMGENV